MSMDCYFSTIPFGYRTGKRNCVALDDQVKIKAGATQKEVPDEATHNIEWHLACHRLVRDEPQQDQMVGQ